MSELVVFTVGVRNTNGKYAQFMESDSEKAIDEYIDIMQKTIDKSWDIVKNKKHYQCVSTEPQIITRK